MVTGHSNGQNLVMKANEKYLVKNSEQPERGKIYDRNGKVLAEDVERYKVVAVVDKKASENSKKPRHVVDKKKTAKQLSKIIEKATHDNIENRFKRVDDFLQAILKSEMLGRNQVSKNIFIAIDYINRMEEIDQELFWQTIIIQLHEAEDAEFERAIRKILSSRIVTDYFNREDPQTFFEYICAYCEMLRGRNDIYK